MPDEDPFEIAKRLDEFGGNAPRPPKPGGPAKAPLKKVVKNKKDRSATAMILLIVALGILGWLIFQRGHQPWLGFFTEKDTRHAAPLQAAPPQMIPALDGKGEVPAFTVQIPGPNPTASQKPRKSGDN